MQERQNLTGLGLSDHVLADEHGLDGTLWDVEKQGVAVRPPAHKRSSYNL